MKTQLFLELDDAVMVVCDRMRLSDDREWVRSELEQRCYLSNDQYGIGYDQARQDIIDFVEKME